MANQLDEENGPIREDGKDINVIAKQIPVKVGVGSTSTYDITDEYIACIKQGLTLGNRRVKLVVDCGNGTGSIIIKKVLI